MMKQLSLPRKFSEGKLLTASVTTAPAFIYELYGGNRAGSTTEDGGFMEFSTGSRVIYPDNTITTCGEKFTFVDNNISAFFIGIFTL